MSYSYTALNNDQTASTSDGSGTPGGNNGGNEGRINDDDIAAPIAAPRILKCMGYAEIFVATGSIILFLFLLLKEVEKSAEDSKSHVSFEIFIIMGLIFETLHILATTTMTYAAFNGVKVLCWMSHLVEWMLTLIIWVIYCIIFVNNTEVPGYLIAVGVFTGLLYKGYEASLVYMFLGQTQLT